MLRAMKNITLSIDERVLKAVRRYAAEHDSSVKGHVREYLTGLAQREDQARDSRKRMRELSDNSSARMGPKTWRRSELH